MNAVTRSGNTLTPVLQPSTFQELVQFAKMAADSDLMPRDYKGKPANVMLAVQMGSEVGLSPMQAVQSIAVINGRPALWGDALIGLCRQSPLCENITEYMEGEGDNLTAVCIAKRKGADPVPGRFSVADAKKAGLWNKPGPWQQYPTRMLQQRARGFALRDAFADVLKGLKTVEELQDYPQQRDTFTGPTIEMQPEPARGQPQETAAAINDSIPALDDGPDYPFETAKGGRIYRSASEWLEAWRRTIEACRRTDALDKLQAAREMNEGAVKAVAEFDPEAAAEVNAALDEALGEKAEV